MFPRETDRKRNRGGTRKATRRGKFYIIISPGLLYWTAARGDNLAASISIFFEYFGEDPIYGDREKVKKTRERKLARGTGNGSSSVLRRRTKRKGVRVCHSSVVGMMALEGYKRTTPCYRWAFSFDGGTNDRTGGYNGYWQQSAGCFLE